MFCAAWYDIWEMKNQDLFCAGWYDNCDMKNQTLNHHQLYELTKNQGNSIFLILVSKSQLLHLCLYMY